MPKFETDARKFVTFEYCNHRGETRVRRVQPIDIYFGTHPQYATARWILEAHDLDKGEVRSFDVQKIKDWTP